MMSTWWSKTELLGGKLLPAHLFGIHLNLPEHAVQKNTIHQEITMLATSKNVLFPGHNHLLTNSADDPSLWLSPEQ